jgi:hypothetical protein
VDTKLDTKTITASTKLSLPELEPFGVHRTMSQTENCGGRWKLNSHLNLGPHRGPWGPFPALGSEILYFVCFEPSPIENKLPQPVPVRCVGNDCQTLFGPTASDVKEPSRAVD